MSHLRLFFCAIFLGMGFVAAHAQVAPLGEANSRIEVLDVAKAENGWTGWRDSTARDGDWTGALKTVPLSNEPLEFRLLFAPTGKRPAWWGQVDVGRHAYGSSPQKSVQNPVIQASENDTDFVSLPVQGANARGPIWNEALGLYTATLFLAPQPQKKGLWQKYRHLRFSGHLADFFGEPESQGGIPIDVEFFIQKIGKSERWGARLRNREAHFCLKSIRIEKTNSQQQPFDGEPRPFRYQYEVITTLVGVWPTGIFSYLPDFPPISDAGGKRVDLPYCALYDGSLPVYQPAPNTPFFVTRRVGLGFDPLEDKEHDSLFLRSHLGWPDSPTVFYPFKLDGKLALGEVPPDQWSFGAPFSVSPP